MKLLCMPLLLLLQNSPVTQLAISKFLVLHLSLENAICPAFSKNLCSHFRSFSIVITLHKPGTLSQYKKTSDISLSIIYQLAVKIHSQFYLSFTVPQSSSPNHSARSNKLICSSTFCSSIHHENTSPAVFHFVFQPPA